MRTPHLRTLTRLGAPCLLAAAALAQGSIQGLGGPVVRATCIAPDGSAIVGYSPSTGVAYVWTPSTPVWTSLNQGQIGQISVSNGGAFVTADLPDPANSNRITASRYDAGTGQWSILPGLGANSGSSVSTSYGISADGQKVVGLAWKTAGEAHAFEWTPAGGTVDLGAQFQGFGYPCRANAVSADGSTVVGWSSSGRRAARWSGGTGAFLGASLDPANPVTGNGECNGCSSDGTYIVGTSANKAFLWDATNGMTDLGAIGVPGSMNPTGALAVSDNGDVVVGFNGLGGALALIWTPGMTQVESLQTYLVNQGVLVAGTWGSLNVAYDVSADGRFIVGYGTNPSGQAESFLVTLPDVQPATYCTSGTTSSGCSATISASANPRIGYTTPCQITVSNVDGQKTGIVFYGLAPLPQPWCPAGGGTSFLCVKTPTQRAVTQGSGGTFAQCNGTLTLDWNAFQLATPNAVGTPWVAGEKAYVQGWFRDPPSCKTTSLSDAIELQYLP